MILKILDFRPFTFQRTYLRFEKLLGENWKLIIEEGNQQRTFYFTNPNEIINSGKNSQQILNPLSEKLISNRAFARCQSITLLVTPQTQTWGYTSAR